MDVDELRSRTLRKVTWRLVPFLCLLYFVNYLDRVNIGFAGPNGLTQELGLSATAFGFASGVFFVGYLLLEVPSNLALHRFGARRWIARIMLTWGVVATAMAFVPNAPTLHVLRFLLGIAEAGFFPGIILYLTYWFPSARRARVVALFMAAVPVSSAIGATVSSLLLQYGEGVFGLSGWRFMFLAEGVPALGLAVVTWLFLTDGPARARWLAPEEREWLTAELAAEQAATERSHGWSLRRALTHPRVLGLAVVYAGVVYGLYALGFFLPTIIAGFEQQYGTRYGVVERGLINAVPYVVSAVVMVWWARHGDRTGERVWHVALPALVGGLAIPVALYLGNPLAAMVAVTVCAVGVLSAMPTFWQLPTRFLTGAAAAGAIGLVNSLGNVSGFVAPYVTGSLRDLTGSQRPGLWLVGLAMVLSAVMALVLGAAPRRPATAEPQVSEQ
ncbi:Major Facilitator Superfamily protein [Streptoalloteichus tenebrarius]|uniref:Major Facilitator Superfamily protein n=1 Tax=Streptoalloteichus tenebrarius (strain ATCC 17920 / DSM 40477 / JCM 4838 / CBS 697.72 / NBRC 16177 / NCIMB 11028 / NRRL B-12390 / A12253. 1 / ISP 5477) TaxID=1933 RepID=A0ABT1I3I7_STRSD|nr:MFS transporter [Streptoalloteichus tenebrarius]MCP2262356.1 Major Facilitator Superfamily protein [Streptoalloteichus tenebrarius]BFF02041.1 MFS transporter [Streptoalloteichus tenebrarius]